MDRPAGHFRHHRPLNHNLPRVSRWRLQFLCASIFTCCPAWPADGRHAFQSRPGRCEAGATICCCPSKFGRPRGRPLGAAQSGGQLRSGGGVARSSGTSGASLRVQFAFCTLQRPADRCGCSSVQPLARSLVRSLPIQIALIKRTWSQMSATKRLTSGREGKKWTFFGSGAFGRAICAHALCNCAPLGLTSLRAANAKWP